MIMQTFQTEQYVRTLVDGQLKNKGWNLQSGKKCNVFQEQPRTDEERKKLIEHLRGLDVPTLVMVVADAEDGHSELDPGPMVDKPQNFQLLTLGNIQQGLMNL